MLLILKTDFDGPQAMTVFSELCANSEAGVTDMKYRILEQKYLELLEKGLSTMGSVFISTFVVWYVFRYFDIDCCSRSSTFLYKQ